MILRVADVGLLCSHCCACIVGPRRLRFHVALCSLVLCVAFGYCINCTRGCVSQMLKQMLALMHVYMYISKCIII